MSSLKQKIQESIELLSEVIAKRGAYSQDHLQHAENVMENASERARKVTKNLEEIAGLLDEATKQIQENAKFYRFKKYVLLDDVLAVLEGENK